MIFCNENCNLKTKQLSQLEDVIYHITIVSNPDILEIIIVHVCNQFVSFCENGAQNEFWYDKIFTLSYLN